VKNERMRLFKYEENRQTRMSLNRELISIKDCAKW